MGYTPILYKAPEKNLVDKIVENPILNRTGNEVLGNTLPTIVTEFLLRGWKRGLEMTTVMGSYLVTTFFLPTALMPVWNKFSANEYELPKGFKNLFRIEYDELIDTSDINVFKNRLIELEGEKTLQEFLDSSVGLEANKKLEKLRDNLIKAKSSAIKKNICTTGLFANLVYWFKNWFAKNVLGVTGYTGELNVLDESQIARNSSTYEKNKGLLFGGSILSYILGSHVFSKTIDSAVSSNKRDSSNPLTSFVKNNIKSFDVKDGIYPRRCNLFGMYMSGGVFSYLFSARSVTELIENVVRLVVWLPLALGGDTCLKDRAATKLDNKYGTQLLEKDEKTGKKAVKSLDTLFEEAKLAAGKGDSARLNLLEKTISARKRLDLHNLLQNALIMGIGLTSFNILFSWWRLRNGIGVK